MYRLTETRSSRSFIRPLDIKNLPSCRSTICVVCEFEPDQYTTGLYQHYGINFPPRIQSSVLKRQAEFLAGRVCAQSALQEFGYSRFDVIQGKTNDPIWPVGLSGSITHSNNYAAALVCKSHAYAGVGIDIEDNIEGSTREAMTQLVVNKDELCYLRSVTTSIVSLDRLLTLVFSSKESFFKAAFSLVGRYFDFSAVHITEVDLIERTITLQIQEALCEELPVGSLVKAHYQLLNSSTLMTFAFLEHN
ncbi:hypothetical protein BTA51_26110 [Hahella sp. CCB-MM4]|uniref:4'-phosphopantetheinyl transferase family protein n=1 Tax=Hahella sp. (strain CCB-MM4) TaxID=1926491 RepID=UPI000BD8AB1D|nr:4'-phosphopantetheinyl transferase superfamily protein [Hahella sp. CCB-MM4]OZG70445.1 hypothetical protein BTA51_26110 [Hahella sp. CCB-MM4]